MKHFFSRAMFLTLFMLLIGCGQSVTATRSPFPSPSATPTINTHPSETTTATIEPAQTLIPTPTLEPTLLPTIEPTLIPDFLSSAFLVQTLKAMNGHTFQRITGWEYGLRPPHYCFGPYKWLNQNHLLLFPLVGQEYGMGITQLSLPLVINYETGKVWIPSAEGLLSLSSCDQPLWSQALNVLIATRGGETIILSPEGDIINHSPGINASLSPSGKKLVAGGVWIDLLSGRQVVFSSHGDEVFSTWSSDENQLYNCCYSYGNVSTGQADRFELDGLRLVGRDYPEGSTGIARAMWVMHDTYIVTHWDFQNDTKQNILPLIEPATQTYKDLVEVTDIPDDATCRLGSVAPDRKQIWANCYRPNNYLVDLETLATQPYPGDLTLAAWSSDSNFAWLRNYNQDGTPQILSITNQHIQPLPTQPQVETLFWHPRDNVLAYLSQEKQALTLLDASTLSVRELALPIAFHNLTWSPNGEQIALTAEDGSLWQVEYQELKDLEQLTQPMPEMRDVQWSPAGTSLAFVSGSDIYIVDTTK